MCSQTAKYCGLAATARLCFRLSRSAYPPNLTSEVMDSVCGLRRFRSLPHTHDG